MVSYLKRKVCEIVAAEMCCLCGAVPNHKQIRQGQYIWEASTPPHSTRSPLKQWQPGRKRCVLSAREARFFCTATTRNCTQVFKESYRHKTNNRQHTNMQKKKHYWSTVGCVPPNCNLDVIENVDRYTSGGQDMSGGRAKSPVRKRLLFAIACAATLQHVPCSTRA